MINSIYIIEFNLIDFFSYRLNKTEEVQIILLKINYLSRNRS